MTLSGTEDEALFKHKALPLWLEGLDLKNPKMESCVQEFLRFHEEKLEFIRRKISDGYIPFVYQLSEKPPAYCVGPDFEGIQQIAQELCMTSDMDRFYFLRYFHGGDFLKFKRRSAKKFRRYTVEALGMQTSTTNANLCKLMIYPLTDMSKYKHPPFYWHEAPWRPIQIWRIRVFDCPLETIKVPLSNPLSIYTPPISQFEWRWHPDRDPELYFYEPSGRRMPQNIVPRSFSKYCRSITRTEIKRGRPEVFTDPDFFIKIFTDARQKLKDRNGKASMGLIAEDELQVNRKTLRKYLNRFGVL